MNVEIAQRLAIRRKQAGLSQEALAEQLGVSRQAVSKWERSESSPDTDNLIALAQLYGVSLDELLYAEEDAGCGGDQGGTESEEEEMPQGWTEAETTNRSGMPDGADAQASQPQGAESDEADEKKVHIGFDGIHVLDGDDYVHVSWRDGVHVKDNKKGEEVHVGWEGVRVKDRSSGDSESCAKAEGSSDRHAGMPHGFTVNGEHFETVEDARAKYGQGGRGENPWWSHRMGRFERLWMKFPYPLAVILVYVLLGVFVDAWGMGLFLFFSIPVYYMLGHAVARRRLYPFVAGVYPIGVVAWFCYMAFVLNEWHPAWAAFLTIPLFEWLVHSLSRWWRNRSRSHDPSAPIDVEAK